MGRYTGWDDQAVRKALDRAPRGKYGSKKVLIDGISFDSKKEAARYAQLKLMAAAGIITELKCHPDFDIWIAGLFICKVELDFSYREGSRVVYQDVKGHDNALSRLKRKLVEAAHSITVDLV